MWSARYFCLIITKFAFPRQIFAQVPSIKFHGNLSGGGPRWYVLTHEERNRRKSPVNVGKCLCYYTWGHIAETSDFKPVAKCVPGSIPLRPIYFPVDSADTCFKFAVLTAAMVIEIFPVNTNMSCQTTCFTPTPNTTGNIRITVRLWRVRVMFIPPLLSQAWSHFTRRRRLHGYSCRRLHDNVRGYLRKGPDISAWLSPSMEFLDRFSWSPHIKFYVQPSSGSGHTWRWQSAIFANMRTQLTEGK
jgi:hypothetical protein